MQLIPSHIPASGKTDSESLISPFLFVLNETWSAFDMSLSPIAGCGVANTGLSNDVGVKYPGGSVAIMSPFSNDAEHVILAVKKRRPGI